MEGIQVVQNRLIKQLVKRRRMFKHAYLRPNLNRHQEILIKVVEHMYHSVINY